MQKKSDLVVDLQTKMLASANMVNDPLIDRLKNKLKEAASELMRTLNENM